MAACDPATTISSTDLSDLKKDITTIDTVVESNLDTTVTKDGKTINTLTGQLKLLGFQAPVAYAGGISFTVNDGTKTIERNGIVYAPFPSELPFTTTGTWVGDDADKFFVVQGLFSDSPLLISRPEPNGYTTDILADTLGNNVYHSDFYNSNKINTSGSKWIRTGVVNVGLAGTEDFPSMLLYNANGVEYRLEANEINVTWFGALGDGVTDDYDAFFDAAQTGLPIYVPESPNQYLIGTRIDYNALKVAGNTILSIKWRGDGLFKTIIKYTGTGDFFRAGDTNAPYYPPGVHFSDMEIYGNGNLGHTSTSIAGYTTTTSANAGTDGTQRGFLFSASGLYPSSFTNVRMRFWDMAMEMDELYYGMNMQSCLFQSNNTGLKLGNNTTACSITRTEFSGNAVGVHMFGSNQNNMFSDGVFQANTAGAGMLSSAGESIWVNGHYWTGNVNDFIHIGNNTISNPVGGILNTLFWGKNFGGAVNVGDNIRHIFIDENLPSSFADGITNNYTQQIGGVIRRFYVGTNNYDVSNLNFMKPFTDFNGGQANEIIHGTAGTELTNLTPTTVLTGTNTILSWGSETWDDENYHSNTTNPSRITVDRPAKYQISASVTWTGNSTGYRNTQILLNGTTVIARSDVPATTSTMFVNVDKPYRLDAGDYLEVQVFQNSGGNLDVLSISGARPTFSIQMY